MFFLWVVGCWVALFVHTVFRKRPPQAREVKRDRRWTTGFCLQIAAIGMVWVLRRPADGEVALGAIAAILATISLWMMLAAQRELGKQFAYRARLVEGHKLITTGPYRLVRNPIYTGLYGLTLATALAHSRWIAIPLFTASYAAGTAIRVKAEERLLRGAFGAEFEAYARRTPAVIPGARL
jgi:protein-S-isoprenylcysteine O-methyltransferase Ste14